MTCCTAWLPVSAPSVATNGSVRSNCHKRARAHLGQRVADAEGAGEPLDVGRGKIAPDAGEPVGLGAGNAAGHAVGGAGEIVVGAHRGSP